MYESIKPFFGPADSNLAASTDDKDRILAYDAYENIYKNNPDTFALTRRGEDDRPMYIPSAKKIIEATNRFLAVGWDYVVGKKKGSPAEQESTNDFLHNLFKRERMYSKFGFQRRFGLVRGDAVWHIIADDTKPEGQRITIQEVKPHHYFPIKDDDNNPDRITGVHLCNIVPDFRDKKKKLARRQTYRKLFNDLGVVIGVESSLGLYEVGKWDDRYLEPNELVKIKTVREPFTLPGIMTLPVYHIPNGYNGSGQFGSSQLEGIESVIAGVNQSLSDEQLTLVMQGLGVYATNAGPALDASGNEGPYEIGPAVVLELPAEGKLERISGVTTVAPMIDHMKFALEEAQLGAGIPDIAAGRVDVSIAESGISLKLQMAPILAQNKEREDDMLNVYDQMIYDLNHYWLPSFESFNDAAECEVSFAVDDPLPINREAEIAELVQLVTPVYPGMPPLITVQMAIDRLTELGYEYPENALAKLREDAAKAGASATPDDQANRYEEELAAGGDGSDTGPGNTTGATE